MGLLAALVSRFLIPLGYMPGPGGLTICSGYAPTAMAADASSQPSGMDMSGDDMSMMDMAMPGAAGHHDGKTPVHDGGLCPFAALAAGAAVLHALPSVAGVAPVRQTSPSFVSLFFQSTFASNYLARGPPSLT